MPEGSKTKSKASKSAPLKTSDFVHLHNHTHHSLLDGLTKIPKLVDKVKEYGMEAVAITDHGTLSGAIEFYKSATAAEIKPIIGIETYVAARKHTDKDAAKDKQRFHLILLAMNNKGYENLMRLSSIANVDGYYFKPRIDHDLMKKYSEGVICLSGCIGGEVGDALRNGNDKAAEKLALKHKEIYGDRYYLEVQASGHEKDDNPWQPQIEVNAKLIELGKKLGIPCVLTSDAHYLDPGYQDAHEALLCVGTGSFVSEEKRMSLKEFDLSVRSAQDLIDIWGDEHPDLIRNSKAIADRCDVTITLGEILIPRYETPKGTDEQQYLELLTYAGAAWRYGGFDEPLDVGKLKLSDMDKYKKSLSKETLERFEFELGVIGRMGFPGYFLIVWDFIKWGKDQGIVFGPGRGSAAGSVVSYALRITEMDPFEYDLLFERFLNPDRISMPDIDIDIQDDRRAEVIQYCVDKYGEDRVAHIVTYGTMAGRAAIRDVARVLEVPYGDADRLAKLVPPPIQGRHIPLEVSIKEDPDFKKEYKDNPVSTKVVDLAIQLEGTMRSHGVHAAGVVIAPDELIKFCPIEVSKKGPIATQYSMNPIDELGLLKVDFLGLSNLTIIKNALRIIKAVHGTDIDIESVPLDDRKTYQLFADGDTNGVFQFESGGMRSYLKKLKPTRFDDIVAMVALYRPGPMQFIDSFIDRKHGKEDVTFMHPKMEKALAPTYGILVYQEQFMQISKDLAGFTGGQADTLRKAVGKKIMEMMVKIKPEFIEGAIEHSGADREMMEKFWEQLEEFANYCFNKSHAACYALISYWTAYLKANYTQEYMASLMTSNFDDTDKLASEITECRKLGIEVLPPDVNESYEEFATVGKEKKVRFGLIAIKNFGRSSAEHIVEIRNQDGPFKDFTDFVSRVDTSKINRKAYEALIRAGAFDSLANRDQLVASIDEIVSHAQRLQKERDSRQADLFAGSEDADRITVSLDLPENYNAIDPRLKLQWEKENLGVYISAHPLDAVKKFFDKNCMPINKILRGHEGKMVTIGGGIAESKEITTRKGQRMAFITVEDYGGSIEAIAFPKVYAQSSSLLGGEKIVVINGKVSTKTSDGQQDEIKILIEDVREIGDGDDGGLDKSFSDAMSKVSSSSSAPVGGSSVDPDVKQELFINLQDSSNDQMLIKLRQLLKHNPGPDSVILVTNVNGLKRGVRLPFTVAALDAKEPLGELVGADSVHIRSS